MKLQTNLKIDTHRRDGNLIAAEFRYCAPIILCSSVHNISNSGYYIVNYCVYLIAAYRRSAEYYAGRNLQYGLTYSK